MSIHLSYFINIKKNTNFSFNPLILTMKNQHKDFLNIKLKNDE